MENKSLLFLPHPNYYNGSSTPYNYYIIFPKKTNFRKKKLILGNTRMTLKLTNKSKLPRETLFVNSLFLLGA
jgi:hypothetical protein